MRLSGRPAWKESFIFRGTCLRATWSSDMTVRQSLSRRRMWTIEPIMERVFIHERNCVRRAIAESVTRKTSRGQSLFSHASSPGDHTAAFPHRVI